MGDSKEKKGGMTFGSLFSGIGGLDLGLERAGWRCAWQVEKDDYCNQVLEKHWPTVRRWKDVRDFPPDPAKEWQVDLIAGGFPCQPVSLAGRRKGTSDPRWLWPEFARIITVLRPRFVLVENVPGLLSKGMGDILIDLAACGYDAEWGCIPAAAVGAPHLRYRIWIVAYPQHPHTDSKRLHRTKANEAGQSSKVQSANKQGRIFGQVCQTLAYADEPRLAGSWVERFGTPIKRSDWWNIEPNVGRVAHGVPYRVDRLRGLGNACVPQVTEWIGRRILECFLANKGAGDRQYAPLSRVPHFSK